MRLERPQHVSRSGSGDYDCSLTARSAASAETLKRPQRRYNDNNDNNDTTARAYGRRSQKQVDSDLVRRAR
eukprot:5767420-Prymnesium_polylepis.2